MKNLKEKKNQENLNVIAKNVKLFYVNNNVMQKRGRRCKRK